MLRPVGLPRASAPSRRRAAERQRARRIDLRGGYPVRSADHGARGQAGRAVSPRGGGRPGDRRRGGRAAVRPALQHERPGRDLGHRQHAGDVPGSRSGLRRLPGRHRERRRAEQQQLRDGPGRRRRGSRHVQLVELDVHAAGRQPGAVRGPLLGWADELRRRERRPPRTPPRAARRCCRRPRAAGTYPSPGRSPTAARPSGSRARTSPFADVTALVTAGGSGRYQVANVQSGTGLDRYAGWSLVVVYRDLALPLRNLSRVRRARDDQAERAAAPDRRERLPDAAQRAGAHLGRARRLRGRPR